MYGHVAHITILIAILIISRVYFARMTAEARKQYLMRTR